ncbi:MAG: type II toxin-antitoxin system RelE/ParE family toxin [Cyanobacterium sp. T60_A2020_053]|nr:type II toxin-antitoxin system RelE/ParE family toxin [Cyanobacterium sp. T60_A2020_053]
MIKSFQCKETEKIFLRKFSSSLPAQIQKIAQRKLSILDAAEKVEDLRIPPGNRLEKLKGDREGQYSIRINEQWRLCFTWQEGNAFDVQIVDYH